MISIGYIFETRHAIEHVNHLLTPFWDLWVTWVWLETILADVWIIRQFHDLLGVRSRRSPPTNLAYIQRQGGCNGVCLHSVSEEAKVGILKQTPEPKSSVGPGALSSLSASVSILGHFLEESHFTSILWEFLVYSLLCLWPVTDSYIWESAVDQSQSMCLDCKLNPL